MVNFITLLALLFGWIRSDNEKFSISITSYNPDTNAWTPNKLHLTRGRFTNITIEIRSLIKSNPLNHAITDISWSNLTHYVTNKAKYTVDPSHSRRMKAYIGIKCSDEETESDTIWLIPTNTQDFKHENCIVTFAKSTNIIYLAQSSTSIPNGGFGVFYLSKSWRNVDEIPISFTINNPEHANELKLDSTFTLKTEYDENRHINLLMKYASVNSEKKDVDQIAIEVSIPDTLKKCYAIAEDISQYFVSISTEETISNTNDKIVNFIGYSFENVFTISSINPPVIPSLLQCVILAVFHPFPKDDEIIAQINSKPYPEDSIAFAQGFFSESHPTLRVSLALLNRYYDYKVKCIYSNNANPEIKSLKTSNTFIINKLFSGLSNVTHKPVCSNLFFKKALQETVTLNTNLKLFSANRFLENTNSKYNGCITWETRDVTDWYDLTILPDKPAYGTSICWYENGICPDSSTTNFTNIFNIMIKNWDTSDSLLKDLKVENEISSTQIWNSLPLLSKIKSTLKEHNESKVAFDVINRNAFPISCIPLFGPEDVLSRVLMFEDLTKEFNLKVNETKTISFNFDAKVYNDVEYSLYLKCSSLPNMSFNSQTVTMLSKKIIHSKDLLIDCNKTPLIPQCITTEPFTLPSLLSVNPNVTNILSALSVFDNYPIDEKLNQLIYQDSLLKQRSQWNEFLQTSLTMNTYLISLDCSNYIFEKCQKKKTNFQNNIISNYSRFFNEDNVFEYFKAQTSKYWKNQFELLLINLIFSGNNGDSFEFSNTKFVLQLLKNWMDKSKDILALFNTVYEQDTNLQNYLSDVIVWYQYASSSLINIIPYIEKDVSSRDNFLREPLLYKYKESVWSSWSELYIATHVFNFTTNNFVFNYNPIERTSSAASNGEEKETNVIKYEHEGINISIRSKYFASQPNAWGVVSMLFKRYPWSSITTSKNISHNILSWRVYSKENENNVIKEELLNSQDDAFEITYDFNNDAYSPDMNSCFTMFQGNLTTKITSEYDENKKVLLCRTSYATDIVVMKSKTSNFLIVWLVIGALILLSLVIWLVYCIMHNRKKLKKEQIEEVISWNEQLVKDII